MAKERGNLFMGSSENVPKGTFLLASMDREVESGEEIKNQDMNIIYASVDGSEADKLIAMGIARKSNQEGKNVILITNKDQDVQF